MKGSLDSVVVKTGNKFYFIAHLCKSNLPDYYARYPDADKSYSLHSSRNEIPQA